MDKMPDGLNVYVEVRWPIDFALKLLIHIHKDSHLEMEDVLNSVQGFLAPAYWFESGIRLKKILPVH